MESRADMLARHAREIYNAETLYEMKARHARELAELESKWWEEWFTIDPAEAWSHWHNIDFIAFMKSRLPAIIRKREKIGVVISRPECDVFTNGLPYLISFGNVTEVLTTRVAIKLAGRTLAPGEKVEI